MKIVLTDARTMNPGDIPWDSFFTLGDVTMYEYTDVSSTLERVKNADIIVANKTIISREIIEQCENLKLICVSATGYNNVDTSFAAEQGIPVCNAANYSSESVGQHVFAMLLNEYNSVAKYNRTVHEGRWSKSKDFTYYDKPIEEIANKNFGIIGLGNLGKQVAKLARAFGANVFVLNHPLKSLQVDDSITLLAKEEFLAKCDIISIHVPLTDKTKDLIDEDFLAAMKRSAILINTSRGPVVDEQALANALKNNRIRAALIDVLPVEPPESSPLFRLQNCTITPHQAWASLQARQRLMKIVEANIRSFQDGNIENRVN